MDPLSVIKLASERVPAINYAIGLAGLAAVASIIIGFLGNTQNAILIIVLILCGSVLIFIFSIAVQSKGRIVQTAAIVLIWAILLSFICFLIMTLTAFVFGEPCSVVNILGISGKGTCGKEIVNACKDLPTIAEYWECLREQ